MLEYIAETLEFNPIIISCSYMESHDDVNQYHDASIEIDGQIYSYQLIEFDFSMMRLNLYKSATNPQPDKIVEVFSIAIDGDIQNEH